jgi:hypothetical protein
MHLSRFPISIRHTDNGRGRADVTTGCLVLHGFDQWVAYGVI